MQGKMQKSSFSAAHDPRSDGLGAGERSAHTRSFVVSGYGFLVLERWEKARLALVVCSVCRRDPGISLNPVLRSVAAHTPNPFRRLELVNVGIVQSVTCEEILNEFQEKLDLKFSYSPEHARGR